MAPRLIAGRSSFGLADAQRFQLIAGHMAREGFAGWPLDQIRKRSAAGFRRAAPGTWLEGASQHATAIARHCAREWRLAAPRIPISHFVILPPYSRMPRIK